MTAARQQGTGEQLDLFDEALQATVRHGDPGLGGSEARSREEPQADTAWQRTRALTRGLILTAHPTAFDVQGNRRGT